MPFTSWRGVVGCIKPTMRPGTIEDLIRILPDGISIVPLFLDARKGTKEEFQRGVSLYEPLVAQLAKAKVDLIHPEGAPPFMLLGRKGEAALIAEWERKYSVPVFTSGTNHVRALEAVGALNFVGASYFGGAINDDFSHYFTEAGFEVLAMEGIDVPFGDAGALSSQVVYARIKQAFLKHRGKARAIYMLGSGWQVMDIIEPLEQDLGVPVIHPVTARCWEIQRRLMVNQPVKGYGRLLAEMLPG